MKKLLLVIALSTGCLSVFSQGETFIDFGPKIMVGPNIFINDALGSDRYTPSYKSAGWGGGFKFAFDFNTRIAIVGEALYRQQKQVFSMTFTDPTTGTDVIKDKYITLKSIEFPVMLRHNSDAMQYFEAGVVFSNIKGVDENFYDLQGSEIELSDFSSQNLSSFYSQKNMGAVLGVGGYLWGSGNFGVSAGLRFRYDFNDAVATDDRVPSSPMYATDDVVVGSTTPFSIAIVFEANYDLGFLMAKSSCKGRRKFLIGN